MLLIHHPAADIAVMLIGMMIHICNFPTTSNIARFNVYPAAWLPIGYMLQYSVPYEDMVTRGIGL